MDPRRRAGLPDKDKTPKTRDAETGKSVKKADGERREYDFSVLKSLFDDEAA